MDLLSNPIANCSAEPLENDISVWHANICVESLKIVFHFEIRYPSNYPNAAPKVKPFTTIRHPNVFGDYICLDILTMSEETSNTPYRGWTSAYTISSLLVQLESFLFEAVQTRSTYDHTTMLNSAERFQCRACGHTHVECCPEIPFYGSDIGKIKTTVPTKEVEFCFLDECDNVVLDVLLSFCDEETKVKIGHVSLGESKALDLALARERYKCFYTLKKVTNDAGVILGLGAKADIMDRRSRKTRRKTAQLQRLHGSFDFLSWDAFQQGVRNNIWKDRDFDYFIPLYINSQHGKLSLPLAEKCMVDMWTDPKIGNKRPKLTPATILETLAKFMSTTVVNMMKTVEDLEAGELQLFDSIKALEGFCSMHHLLLAFANKYPAITEVASQKVKYFIENPEMRDKEVTPDVGELLISVALSSYTWDDFSPAWLEESFIRNQRWICAKYPNLLKIENASSCVRLTQSFNATRTGKRLAMFQRFFISEVASPARLKGNPNKNKVLLKEYNLRMGLPEKGMAEKLQAHSRKVIGCTNWWDYFSLVDFCPPGHARLSSWLRNSLRISELKQYHSPHYVLRYTESFITQPEETDQCDKLNCLCAGSLFKLPENCKVIKGGHQKPQIVRKAKTGIDICFVMDCTGSMSSWIATAKERIQQIIESVSTKADGVVRFAIVGYRDHDSQGWGDDAWVLKKFDFTRSSKVAKERLLEFRVGGGGGYEAMCCAMDAAANMSWNRDAHQIVVSIGDQPPHGYINDRDFPDGCPCGSDTLRIAHTMEKNGIVIYPVDCGRQCANRETFYHALARITGGYAINLKESNLLPEIVFGACMEEKLMDKLSGLIAPVYDNCLKSHSGGRFEQHCRSVYAELNAKGLKVESCLPADNYDQTIEHQVDCIAFCTDIKQAKAMATSEYFVPINRHTKLCSYMERPVTQGQVTKCMKRMETKVAERRFLEHGCQYRSAGRFTQTAFRARWTKFIQSRGIQGFHPWNKLSSQECRAFGRIPDGEKLRRLTNKCTPMTSVGVDGPVGIPGTLIGKKIEVQYEKKWIEVKIVSKQRGGKYRVIMPDGFDATISEKCTWRQIKKKDPWGAKKATTAPATQTNPPVPERSAPVPRPAAPAPVPQVAAPVPQRATQVTAPAAVAPQLPARVMRKNISIEVSESIANQARVVAAPRAITRRDSAESDSGRSISRSMSVEPSPRGALKPSPPHCFVLGQVVECKNAKEEKVHRGIVQNLQPLMVKVEGFKVGRWRFVRDANMVTEAILMNDENVFSGPDPNSILPMKASKGTNVKVLEIVGEFAHVVFPFDGWVQIKSQPKQTKSEPQNEPKLVEEILLAPVTVYSAPNDRSSQKGKLGAGVRIKVLEFVNDFAHIVYPEDGFIDLKRTISASPEPESQSQRVPAQTNESKTTTTTNMLATIECLVSQNTTARNLAMACDFSGALPKSVRIKLIDNCRVGVVGFEAHGDAEKVLSQGLVVKGKQLLVKWSPEYLNEIAV